MKYQVIPLGTPWRIDDLKNALQDFPDIHIMDINDVEKYNPVLYLYYGHSKNDAEITDKDLEEKLEKIISQKSIQPIAIYPDDFKKNFPSPLKSLNGFFLDETEFSIQALKNLILSYFGILEGNRKVFISYRRDDLEKLAQNLFDQLIKKKYIPFLDSYSLEAGVDFQEYLRHELVDSDIIILLDTPGFNSSPYCMEEFNIANAENIPVLDIRFNIDEKKNLHRFCDYKNFQLPLEQANTDKNLPNEIISLMERSRANAFCIKRKFVLDEFNKRCNDFGLHIVEQGGFLRCDATHECFYPTTNIPDARKVFDIDQHFKKTPLFSTYTKQILYNGNYCRPDIEKHLEWLNNNLPIKVYNVTK